MGKCWISLVLRERKIISTMKHHYTSTGMVQMKKTDNTKSWRRSVATRILIPCRWVCKLTSLLGTTVGWHPLKLTIYLLCNIVMSLLRIYSTHMHSCAHQKTNARMSTVGIQWKDFLPPLPFVCSGLLNI